MTISPDLIGKSFDFLLVLERAALAKKKEVHWNCFCKYCGNNTYRRTSYLLGEIKGIKSCGCLQRIRSPIKIARLKRLAKGGFIGPYKKPNDDDLKRNIRKSKERIRRLRTYFILNEICVDGILDKEDIPKELIEVVRLRKTINRELKKGANNERKEHQ